MSFESDMAEIKFVNPAHEDEDFADDTGRDTSPAPPKKAQKAQAKGRRRPSVRPMDAGMAFDAEKDIEGDAESTFELSPRKSTEIDRSSIDVFQPPAAKANGNSAVNCFVQKSVSGDFHQRRRAVHECEIQEGGALAWSPDFFAILSDALQRIVAEWDPVTELFNELDDGDGT